MMLRESSRVLFAQELGGGFGHVNTLIAVARHFRDHRLTFAVCDPALTGPAIRHALGATTPVWPCFLWRGEHNETARFWPPETMADVLFQLGYADPAQLADAVASWEAILAETSPDLIVSDFAPTLRVVTGPHIPLITTGNGFVVPPALDPLPSFRAGSFVVSATTRRREVAVLSAVNRERTRLWLPTFGRAADLLRGDRTFVTTLAALDPYRHCRSEALLSPINIPAMLIGPAIHQRCGPHIFCYFDADATAINPLLSALNGLGRPAQIYIRNVDPNEVAGHCAPHVGVHRDQADFLPLLPQTRLLIHHGGIGTTTAGLLAGTPQILLPRHLEQELTADAVAPFGASVALRLAADADPAHIKAMLARLLDNTAMHAAALRQAAAMRRPQTDDAVQTVVAACNAMLNLAPMEPVARTANAEHD